MNTTGTATAIEIQNLTKAFGTTVAVDDLSFTVPAGTIAGFVGPNGSGKSTTMRILATLEQQDRGLAQVLGMDVRLSVNLRQVRRAIGYMPDYFGLYADMTAGEFLEFFAAAHRIPKLERGQIVTDILNIVDLLEQRDKDIHGLSRGMQQKLSLGRCLVHDPQILILDEPASGLDPRARIELLECLRELRRLGKTILISSHILTELQDLCDILVVIENGKLAYAGPLDVVVAQTSQHVHRCEITLQNEHDRAIQLLQELPGIDSVMRRDSTLEVTHDQSTGSADIIHACAAAGLRIEEAKRSRPSLEHVFMELTRD